MDRKKKLRTQDLLLIAIYECFGVAIISYTIYNFMIIMVPTNTWLTSGQGNAGLNQNTGGTAGTDAGQYGSLKENDGNIDAVSAAAHYQALMSWTIPISWVIASMIAGHVSEGHFNPAVSFAICIARARDKWWTMIWWYWVPQFLGTILCHYILKSTLPDTQYGTNGGLFAYSPVKDGNTYEQAYFVGYAVMTEIWCSFIFCTVVLNVRNQFTTFTGSKLLNYATEAITLWWCLACSYNVTGWSTFNPAIAAGFGLTFALQSKHQALLQFQYLNTWIFVVGPLVGAALAGLFFQSFHFDNCRPNTAGNMVVDERDLTKLSDLNFDEELDHNVPDRDNGTHGLVLG